jgi:hypothetical protein
MPSETNLEFNVKYPLQLSDLNPDWSGSTDFRKNSPLSNLVKILLALFFSRRIWTK